MTETLPSARVRSVRLLPGTSVTVLGRGRTARTAADILRSVGAEVTAVDAAPGDIDLSQLADDETVVCDVVHEGVDAGYLAAVAARRRGAWVTVSAFGLDGPLGGQPGTDLLSAAAGGLLGAVTDTEGDSHLMPGSQALRVGGQAAALAALHAISLVRGGQDPLHLDLSVQEAVAFCTIQQEAAHLIFECGGKPGASRYVAPSGYFTCTDGEILIMIVDDHQMVRFAEVIGRPDWPAKYPRQIDRAGHQEEINEVVGAWTATRSKFGCEHLLQDNGVAATAVRTLREAATNEQYEAREFLLPEDYGRLAFGVLPALVTPLPPGAGPRGQGVAASRTLGELRVAEVTNVLAGPLAGAVIGAMGATVVRLEEGQRLDLYRRNGPFQFGQPDREKAAYYLFANYNKRSVYRRVEDDPGFAPSVVGWADMVLENLGRRRLDSLGIGTVGAPQRMMVSVSGFGRTGPCANYKAYAPNVHCFAGLRGAVHQLSDPDATIRTSLADYCVALWAATLSAAWWLGGADPSLFDLSMAEVIATKLEGLPVDASHAKDAADAPGLILRCSDGAVAVSRGSGTYAEALAAAGVDLDKVPTKASPVAVSADVTSAGCGVANVLDAARRAGFGAYEVLKPAGVLADAQLGVRRFLLPLEHPAVGEATIFALPWKVAGSRRESSGGWYRRSPLLGEDDDWIDEQLGTAAVAPLEGAPQ